MLNQVVLVGRLDWMEEEYNAFQIIVDKTPVEIYTTDQIFNRIRKYCKFDDIIGVKGIIARDEKTNQQIINATRISFLSPIKRTIN